MLPTEVVEHPACLEIRSSVLSPPFRTHVRGGLLSPSSLSPVDSTRQHAVHASCGSAHGVPRPFSGLRPRPPPSIFQPDPGFEVHDVALTNRAQRLPGCPGTPAGRVGPFPSCITPFEDFPSSTAVLPHDSRCPLAVHRAVPDPPKRFLTRFGPPTLQPVPPQRRCRRRGVHQRSLESTVDAPLPRFRWRNIKRLR